MASLVLQGLFPPTVDSPVLRPANNTESDLETGHEVVAVPIVDHVTSAVAEIFAKLIATFDFADRTLRSNDTDAESAQDFSYITGW